MTLFDLFDTYETFEVKQCDNFDLLTPKRRSDEEVTVDTFECLSKPNVLSLLVLPF